MRIHLHSLTARILLAFTAAVSLKADPLDNWQARNALPAENLLSGIAYGNGIHVAVGSGGILTSADGTHWTAGATNRNTTAIVFGAGRFVAVGFGPSLISTNGTDWLEGEPVQAETPRRTETAWHSETVCSSRLEILAAWCPSTLL
jgi:hypothetical protein